MPPLRSLRILHEHKDCDVLFSTILTLLCRVWETIPRCKCSSTYTFLVESNRVKHPLGDEAIACATREKYPTLCAP